MQLQSSGSRGGVAKEFSVFVGNLDLDTPVAEMEELLYELFLQAGPLSHVHIPFDRDSGRHKCYGFVEFLHTESVPYAIKLMQGIRLCGKVINVKPVTRSDNNQTTPTAIPPNPFFVALNAHMDAAPPVAVPPSLPPFPPPPFLLQGGNAPALSLPPPPLFPPRRHNGTISFPPPSLGTTSPLLPPGEPPLFFPPPPNYLPMPPQDLPANSLTRLHEMRVHAQDHPSWMSEDIKQKISQYHLNELEQTFKHLKQSMASVGPHNDQLLPALPPNPFIK